MRVRITLTFDSENDLRRAMDEIMDAAVRNENMARTLTRRYRGPSHSAAAVDKQRTADVLNKIADALDHAKVEA